MPKKKEDNEKQALTVRAFIKLLRNDKTIEDLDRLRVYNEEHEPITQVSEIGFGPAGGSVGSKLIIS